IFREQGSTFAKATADRSGGRIQGPGVNFTELKTAQELTGPWELSFDPAWFYPDNGTGGKITFDDLSDWTDHADPAIKYYSGLATYRKTFDCHEPRTPTPLFLSLGEVREMARVRINGHDLGVVWCPPWNVKIPAGTLTEKENRLEIEVVNFWPNRLIGDAALPLEQRRTRTNITKFYETKGDKHYTTLIPSGLIGPVTLQQADAE
ncbi:MAG: glycoside hydrolase, partial [Kiritimatiellae bacterium]|nr:glycoside hydrolase [Kiritimatiellia bacterium]